MTFDRRALAGALATVLLVAACGGSASPSPSGAPGATATPAATETQAPTEAPTATETPAANETAGPTLIPGAVADLEAKLPAEVNGVTFTRTSFDGQSLPPGTPIGDSDLEKFLAANGKSLSDVRVAMATPTDTATVGTLVMAIQIKGVSSEQMLSWATTSLDSEATKTTLGGKEVYGSGAAGMGAYFYVKDDVVYYVVSFGGPAGLAEAIISKLP
ncbi:MAG: hypothetical protein M0T75_03535 [Chloroflexi bacterium]|nr:hypothetical protein [Chloroflexota bacterium]